MTRFRGHLRCRRRCDHDETSQPLTAGVSCATGGAGQKRGARPRSWPRSSGRRCRPIYHWLSSAERQELALLRREGKFAQHTSLAFGRRCRKAGVRPSWARWATRTTMRCARASSLRSNGRCSPVSTSPRTHRPSVPRSPSSRAGTTRPACTAASLTTRPCATSNCTIKASANPRYAPPLYEEVRSAPFNPRFNRPLKRGNPIDGPSALRRSGTPHLPEHLE